MTLLKDLITIPEAVHRSDFVISLEDGIGHAAETVNSYVVTDQLADCFDRGLGLIDAVVSSGASKGAYLHGSFGSGKSHFMVMLHLLLQGDPHARSKPELSSVVAKYEDRLRGRKFLLVPFHMVGAASMEAGVLGGYVEHVRRLHPEAPLPAVYLDDALLDDARRLRDQLGDDTFFSSLRDAGEDEGFGDLAGGWGAERFENALSAAPGSPERNALVSDYIDAFASHVRRTATATGTGFVSFADGLSAISRHAKGLGYDAVVLFLDELILWFASRMADPTFVNTEGPKVAKLVEAATADRPAPIVSFIARQRDLRDFIGQGVPGAERLNFGEILQWWEGRFDIIELSDTNLRAIVEKRLLAPKTPVARQELDHAFADLAADAGGALDTLMTSDADRDAFRRVYPFSPAMIETLVAVSAYLQRERTALRLLLQLLVDKREELAVGDLVPLGDLYDVIRGGEEPFSDELKRHFVRARDLYQARLRPMLLAEHGLTEEALPGPASRHAFHADDRIVKTLLLAALVPTVEPLRGLTVRRLADLNHGTIRTPIPGHEKAAVLSRLRKWAPEVPELRLEGDQQDPTVSLQLASVDVESILEQASHVDNLGARRAKIRELVFEALEIEDEPSLFSSTREWVWRGTRRMADVRFANVRDPADIPDSEFRADGGRPRVIIDFPFDDRGFGPADGLARIAELRDEIDPASTVVWLPLFLTEDSLNRLGRLVVLDHVLAGDRLDGYTQHLSPQDRMQAGQLLRTLADSLRGHLRDVLRQAYGIESPDEQWVQTDVQPRDQFPCLDPTLVIRPPAAPTLDVAFLQLLDQVLQHLYPGHPDFGAEEVRLADLRTALRYVDRAVGVRDQRIDIPQPDRRAVRKVLGPLNIATTGEAHIVLKRDWRDHFHRKQEQEQGSTVTVERLRRWMDEPRHMGLPERIANLVISSYVLTDNRVLVHGGVTVEPSVDRLEPNTEVRTQQLPSESDWDSARPHAQRIFGVDASPIRNAANVARLIASVKEVAISLLEPNRHVLVQLTGAATRLGVDEDADRLRTARAGLGLLEEVRGAEDIEAVAVLARLAPPTSAEALGRSIKSADQVGQALQQTRWELFSGVTRLAGDWGERGRQLVNRVARAFTMDELAQSLPQVLRDEEDAATELLTDAAQRATDRTPEPEKPPETPRPPEPAAPRPPRVTLEAAGSRGGLAGEEAERVLRELLERSNELEEVVVQWRFRS